MNDKCVLSIKKKFVFCKQIYIIGVSKYKLSEGLLFATAFSQDIHETYEN